MHSIVRIAVRIAQRRGLFPMSIGIETKKLIQLLIAYPEKSGLVPHRSLRKTKAAPHGSQYGIMVDQRPEFWPLRNQCKFAALWQSQAFKMAEHQNKKHGQNDRPDYPIPAILRRLHLEYIPVSNVPRTSDKWPTAEPRKMYPGAVTPKST